MSHKVAEKRIKAFFDARLRLPYDDNAVATKMGIDKGSYSSYINRRLPITNNFLSKFYKAFEAELALTIGNNEEAENGYNSDEDLTNLSIEACISLLEKLVDNHETSIRKIRIHLDHLDKKLSSLRDTNERIVNNLELRLNLEKQRPQAKVKKKRY
jgi:transcriptional regulator with XRE-family HTH domain